MATYTFQERYFIAAPIRTVYAHLSEPQNYMGLSPLLVEVSDISRTLDSRGKTVIHYRAVEELRYFGFIKYHNPIRVALTLTEMNKHMLTEVKANLGIFMRFRYDFEEVGGSTWITEIVEAQTPTLLSSYVIGQAKHAQQSRINNLKARMESVS